MTHWLLNYQPFCYNTLTLQTDDRLTETHSNNIRRSKPNSCKDAVYRDNITNWDVIIVNDTYFGIIVIEHLSFSLV